MPKRPSDLLADAIAVLRALHRVDENQPVRRTTTAAHTTFMKSILRHANECGLRLLAGLMTPHRPLRQGERGR